jgi:acyl carrier protein
MKLTLTDLQQIFRTVFENDNIAITNSTVASDIEEWDSLNHIYLIVEIETVFKVKFSTLQIQSWTCVESILNDLNKQLGYAV